MNKYKEVQHISNLNRLSKLIIQNLIKINCFYMNGYLMIDTLFPDLQDNRWEYYLSFVHESRPQHQYLLRL